VDDLLGEYKALWAGQLGKVGVAPHQIEVTPRARPRRAQLYRASHASRDIIAKEVQRQRDLGFIEPSSAEQGFLNLSLLIESEYTRLALTCTRI